MKLSNYAWIVRHENTHILYKCHHETLVAIEEPLKELLERGDWEALEEMHPTFFAYLVERGFLLEDYVDESREVIAEWEREDGDRSVYNIIINPTMDCNMRCWYCYEKHEKGSVMTKTVVDAVTALITAKIMNPELKVVHLKFFGGEPLLYYNEVVLPFIKEIQSLCQQYNKEYSVSFTTNGFLLTKKVLNSLMECAPSYPISLQISLDGNEEKHNKVKFLENRVGSYTVILNNVIAAASLGMHVRLRLNCTLQNIQSFIDVANDLIHLPIVVKQCIIIDFHQVWQDYKNDVLEFRQGVSAVRFAFMKAGFTVKEDRRISPDRCYADKDNGCVINYNGDVFSCTARKFIKDNREGIISDSGEIIWNEKKYNRMMIKYGNTTCMNCNIFPLCHGRCSQFKLDIGRNLGCLCNYTEKGKRELVAERIKFLINNY